MFQSLKSRGLVLGTAILVLACLLAFYTQTRWDQPRHANKQPSTEINRLIDDIAGIEQLVRQLEVVTYRLLLGHGLQDQPPIEKLKRKIARRIASLQRREFVRRDAHLLDQAELIATLGNSISLRIQWLMQFNQLGDQPGSLPIAHEASASVTAKTTPAGQKALFTVLDQHDQPDVLELIPLFDAVTRELANFKRFLTDLEQNTWAQIDDKNVTLPQLPWILAAILMITVTGALLALERWVRTPLRALSSVMRGDNDREQGQAGLTRIGVAEIDTLIASYDAMRSEMERRQRRLEMIVQHAGEGILLVNRFGHLTLFNREAEKLFQRPAAEVLSSEAMQLFDADDPATLERINRTLRQGSSEDSEFLCQANCADGSRVPVDLTISHIILDDQPYTVLVVRDASQWIANEQALNQARQYAETMKEMFSEQVVQLYESLKILQQTQKQLVESEKMASLAGLVAGVAHEINTPVGTSVTATSLLQQELERLERVLATDGHRSDLAQECLAEIRTALTIIETNLQRAASLVRSFKLVAVDRSSEAVRRFNLREYVDEILLSLQPQLKKTRCRVDVEIADDIVLNSVPGALAQVITNLVLNSLVHGFDDDGLGTIRIQARAGDDRLTLGYRDNGKGLTEDTCAKVFEPFFTTRRGEGGSGLGMHISYNLVTATLRGRIECVSHAGEGAAFEITLPLVLHASTNA